MMEVNGYHQLFGYPQFYVYIFVHIYRTRTYKSCTDGSLTAAITNFSFAEIIHPPHRCGISRCWLDSMIIAQVCLRLATIKGHSKMCSFTVFGGLGGSENQSVSGVTTIFLTQCNTSPSHRVDQVVDCGLCNVGPLLFNGCVKLLDINRNWNTLSYTPIQSIPNMLSGWHVRWVCWPCKNWDVFSVQELCTDPCNRGLWIIMLQHEVMVGTTMGLRISSRYLCAFKMPSIKCTCVRCP